MDKKKKPRLKMAVDNDPEYRSDYIHRRVLYEQQDTYQELMQELQEQHKMQLILVGRKNRKEMKDLTDKLEKKATDTIKAKRIEYTIISVIIAGAALLGSYAYAKHSLNVEKIIKLESDLNHDGVNDAYILQENGYKIPMYGIYNGKDVYYVNADNMKRPIDNAIDYNGIENKLNREQ